MADSSGCWPRLNWRKMPCVRWPRENSEPSRQAPRRRHVHYHVEHVKTVGVQGRWANPLHLPTTASSADPCRPGRRHAGLAAFLCHQAPLPRVPDAPGRRCATTNAVRSTRRRFTDSGGKKTCRCAYAAPVSEPECPRSRRSRPTPGRGMGDRLPVRLHHRRQGEPSTARRSRSPRDRRTHPVLAAEHGGTVNHR
jgi:hypothetical protein